MIKILKFIIHHPLASKNKWASILRFFRWQVASRLTPFPIIYPFVGDTKLVVQKGMTGATGNIYTGLHEFNDMAFTLHFLRPDDLFIDIGSNIGSYTVLAAGVAGSDTMTFEPVPSTFRHLKDNIAINHIESKVEALNIGLGANSSSLKFTTSLDTVNHILTDDEIKDKTISRIEVKVERLDDLLNGRVPALMKIDVEGFEFEVLKGGEKTFRDQRLKSIIIELNGSGVKYGYEDSMVHEALLKWGFVPYEYLPFKRTLNKLSHYGNFNTIYIRDFDFTNTRVNEANGFSVLGQII